MNPPYQYDYIITGAGCAGLSFAMHLINSAKFQHKRILIVDKDAKTKNDRTWCFWEKEENLFQPIVAKEWEQLSIFSNNFSKDLTISPYRYKLIHGKDYYNYCLSHILAQKNIQFLQADVQEIYSNETTGAIINDQHYTCQFLFNSIIFQKPQLKKREFYLLQHFKGWYIESSEPVFDSSQATLMDFRTEQKNETRFFYVLPFSAHRALVEFTIFSKKILNDEAYEAELENHIRDTLKIKNFSITEKELGVIPMTNMRFLQRQNNIINLGTAGGQTKGSSGYTFGFIQKHSSSLVQSLVQHGHPFATKRNLKRFHFYDSVLLNILHHNKIAGRDIFSQLFRKNKARQVFKFLDNETNLAEELKIISSLPALPFTRAALSQFT